MLKQFVVILIASALVTGCANLNEDDKRNLGIGAGAIIGGAAGYAVCAGKHKSDRVACAAAGAVAGAVIGGAIAQYLTAQDQANIADTLDDTEQSEPVAWCSGSKNVSRKVKSVQCHGKNKVVTAPGPVAENTQGEICRLTRTEVVMPNGNIETEKQNVCKGEDGKWHAQA